MRRTTPVTAFVSAGRMAAAMAVVCACASGAVAQTPRVEGPFAGLFGGSGGSRATTQSLDVRGSLFGVYQDVLEPSADLLRELDPRFQKSGTFGGASGSVAYSLQRNARRSGFFLAANATAADYSVQPETIMAAYDASGGLNAQLTRKISFVTSASASYAPFYNFGSSPAATGTDLFNLTPGSIPSGAPIGGGGGGIGFDQTLPGSQFGFNSLFEPNIMLGAGAGVTTSFNSRTSLAVTADYRDQRLTHSSEIGYGSLSGAATFRRNITRRLVLRLGYRRDISTYGNGSAQRFSRDGYEIGLDYGDSLTLPLGRRTTLSLVPAATAVRWNDATQFRLNGNATLTHSMGRTWSASAGYGRDLQFVLGFDQPILSDNVTTSLGGTLGRRLRWTTAGGWSRGTVGFADDADHFTWYFANSGLSMALGRNLALYTQYAYYTYNVPPTSTSLDLLTKFSRQSVTAGLTVFAPVFRTGRVRQ
jgi:hypothetical protein